MTKFLSQFISAGNIAYFIAGAVCMGIIALILQWIAHNLGKALALGILIVVGYEVLRGL